MRFVVRNYGFSARNLSAATESLKAFDQRKTGSVGESLSVCSFVVCAARVPCKSARTELTFSHFGREANRRWSMALSSMGHSQTSAQSLQSIAGGDPTGQTERKISFVLHEPDNESEGSSNTTVTVQGEENAVAASAGVQQRRPVAPVRPFLLRRGTSGAPTGGSFKRRSLKLRRGTKDGKDIETDCKATIMAFIVFFLCMNYFSSASHRFDSIEAKSIVTVRSQ